jgi:hypothetical protein
MYENTRDQSNGANAEPDFIDQLDEADIPPQWLAGLPRVDFIDQILYEKRIDEIRELVGREQPYMRNAGLLPHRGEFATVDWYVQLLKLFEQALRKIDGFYQFMPTPAQQWLNAEALIEWDSVQRSRKSPVTNNPLDAWLAAIPKVVDDVRNTKLGNRNGRLRWGAYRLAELGFDEHESKRELERAAQDNGLWRDDGARQCRATIESGWNKGIANPEDLDAIEARLRSRA